LGADRGCPVYPHGGVNGGMTAVEHIPHRLEKIYSCSQSIYDVISTQIIARRIATSAIQGRSPLLKSPQFIYTLIKGDRAFSVCDRFFVPEITGFLSLQAKKPGFYCGYQS